MKNLEIIKPLKHAIFSKEKIGKTTLYESSHAIVAIHGFEPKQEHKLHAHQGMDKVYYVLEGKGFFLLEDHVLPMEEGNMLVAPDGVPHGIRNEADKRLVVMAILAPGKHSH